MRSMKLGILIAVFALSAIGAANASAAPTFTASATGTLTGKALETQKFKTSGGTVECKKAAVSGTITSTASAEQHATVNYSECTAFGFTVDPIEATFLFTANGKVHVKSAVKITVTGGIFGECTITVTSGQEVGSVTYSNNAGKLKVTPNPVTGIKYTSTGGICGASGENGEYSGATEVERSGGGTISWDA